MSRRAARIAAVEVLYGADVREADPLEVAAERGDLDPYAIQLVRRVYEHREELDRLIAAHAEGWSPKRMSAVDRNVLRVGALELTEGNVPPAAAIDEAVEIAKRFSGAEAGRFVNGVLGAILRERSAG